MTRQETLNYMRVAGYHADTKQFTRLVIEGRVSNSKAYEAWLSGVTAKKSGMKCMCFDCAPKGLS